MIVATALIAMSCALPGDVDRSKLRDTIRIAPRSGRAEDEDDPINDCGVNALYTLLRIEGRQISLEAVRRVLPPPGPNGLSMQALVDTGRGLGLRLEGVKLSPSEAPDRPMILLLKTQETGHFVVVRPVGTLGVV